MDEFTSLVNSLGPKIIAITESWCNESIGDAEIGLHDYVLYRCDVTPLVVVFCCMFTTHYSLNHVPHLLT